VSATERDLRGGFPRQRSDNSCLDNLAAIHSPRTICSAQEKRERERERERERFWRSRFVERERERDRVCSFFLAKNQGDFVIFIGRLLPE